MRAFLAAVAAMVVGSALGGGGMQTEERWETAYDFMEGLRAAKVTGSASTEVRTDRAGGVGRSAIFQHPALEAGAPPSAVEYAGTELPRIKQGERLRLRLWIAMSDRIDRASAPNADGCEFAIRVEGRELFRKVWNEQRWFEWSADLTQYAGRAITVVFEVGARANSVADWALWGEPRVEIVGRRWKPREGPKAPSLKPEELERAFGSVGDHVAARTAVQVNAPYGSAVVAAMDPYLDLPIQVERWSGKVGPAPVPLAPTIVAGEGPDPQNHTLIRVLGRYGIARMQFLAYPPDVRGGVSVGAGRTGSGADRIVAAPLAAKTPREIRVFDLDGIPTASFDPGGDVPAPYALAVGDFLPERAGDEVAALGGAQGRLFDLDGKPVARFTVPLGDSAPATLVRVSGARAERLLTYRTGATRATVRAFAPPKTEEIAIPDPARTDGVYPSAFSGRWLAALADPSLSHVAVLPKAGRPGTTRSAGVSPATGNRSAGVSPTTAKRSAGVSPATLDVGAYENLFWYQWYRPVTEGKHVRASDFAHLRTDHATDAGRDPARAADPASWTEDKLVGRFGAKGGFAGYLTDRPKLWEPCFTHRQPKGVFESWLSARDAATGLSLYPMLTRNGRVVEYGEFGNIDFYASTYAFGLPAIDNLYILPLRSFLRKLVGPFRERPEHCAGLEPNHEHEIAVEADASMGDYNLKMIEGFHDYLMRMYGGDQTAIKRAMGTPFEDYFDAPRNWERGPWDAYDLKNPFYRAWTDYNRYVVSRRVAETFREALLAGFPPEIVKCHQIPDTYAIGNLQAFSDVTARFTPIDWMLNAGTGYGFTRYGVWYNRPHDALQDAHSSGFDAITVGEYQALTPDPKAAYEQLRFMFDRGVVAAHCMLWPEGHDRGYNDTMHAALQRLVAEDPPRPGLTGGVGQIRAYSDGKRRFDIACIGTGPNRTGLLKSLKADGSWEGSVYVVPFHAHVEVTPIEAQATASLEASKTLTLGPLADLDSGEQIEIVCEARAPGASGTASRLKVAVTRAGVPLPGLSHSVPIGSSWRPVRYVLRNQLPVTDIRIEVSVVGGKVEIRGMRATRQSEQTAKLTKGRFGGKRHKGAVTFDVIRGER